MKIREKPVIAIGSILLYVAALVVFLAGAALLITNILNYNSTVAAYVKQGYQLAAVTKQLIPQQLLPGIFNSIGIFGGIACAIMGIGLVNQKVTKTSTIGEVSNMAAEESNLEESISQHIN